MSMSKTPPSRRAILSLVFVMLLAGGCAAPSKLQESTPATPANDALNSTLWSLTSAEYDAVAWTVYHAAENALAAGLSDSTWTALPEQAGTEGYSMLPPAVILDVDETVLDNGEYQARLILNNQEYSSESWLDWVLEEKAQPIPGALAFTRRADREGITVIYLTNRREPMEAATRQNLIDLGFPLDSTFDVVLTRGERPEWKRGEKTSRRQYVGEHFRVLAMVGDNLGDFVDIERLGLSQRENETAANQDFWGAKWFMLPNPQYGSWESALFDGRYDLPSDARRRMKLEHLRNLPE